jgi:hypothetical protein
MRNLMMHCGADHVEEQVVRNVPTPAPTDTHFPIPHDVLLDRTLDLITAHGMQVDNIAHAIRVPKTAGEAVLGAQYFGLIEVSPAHDGANHLAGTGFKPDYATVIGLRNSHDKAFAAGLVVGSQVFVCDNLAFSGEVKMSRKHTRNILNDLPLLMEGTMGKLMTLRGFQDHRIQAYKDTVIDDRDARNLIIEGLKLGVVTGSKVRAVVDEWEKPSHEEFAPRTAWSLFNAHTEILKSRGAIFEKPRFTHALHAVMDAASGVQPMKALEEVADGSIELN